MAIFGFLSSTKGVALPLIKEQYNISFTNTGLILFFSSVGYLSATFMGGFLINKIGYKKILILAFITTAIGCVIFPLANNYALVVLGYGLLGLSFGLFEVSVNSLAVKIFIRNAVVLMNLTHLFYGVGASIGPIFSSYILKSGFNWSYIYLFFIAIIIISVVIIIPIKFPKIDNISNNTETNLLSNLKTLIFDKKIWLFALLLGFCMSIEMGLSSWLANYLIVAKGLIVEKSSYYLTLFFVFFTLGRLVSGFIAEKIGHIKIIVIYIIGFMVVVILGLVLNDKMVFLFSVAGFFVSIFFPTIMVIIANEYKENTSQALGTIISFSAIISMTSVFIIGKVNDLIGVSYGMVLILFYGVISILFMYLLKRKLHSYN